MDLDLAGTQGCPHCDFEGYDDDFKNGRCPRCRKSIEDAPSDSGRGGGPQRRRTKQGPAKAGARRKKPAARPAEPEPPQEKRQVILTEAFKTQVFDAFKAGHPSQAQDMCMELAAGNEDHAKQVYGYLLGIARKKGWLGIHKGGGQATPPQAQTPGYTGPGQPLPPPGHAGPGQPLPPPGYAIPGGFPGQPLPPPGHAGPGQPLPPPGYAMPGGFPGQPLPPPGYAMPGGFPGQPLPPGFAAPGAGDDFPPGQDFPTIALGPPPGVGGAGQDFQTIALPPPDMPAPADFQTIAGPPADLPAPPPPQAAPPPPAAAPPRPQAAPPPPAAAPRAGGAPTPRATPRPAAAPRAGGAPTPSATPRPAAALPPTKGFLARVAMEGRAAQVSLLCQAGRPNAALELAKSTLSRTPDSPRAHAALGESYASLGELQQALQAYTNAVRADPTDTVCVRGYARHLVRLGRHPEAADAFRRIVAPGRGRVEDAVALAEALRKGGDQEGSRRVLDEVMRRDPQSLEPLRQEVESRAQAGDLTGAAERLEQLLAKEESPHPMALGLAEALAERCAGSSSLGRVCAQVFDACGRSLQAVRLLLPLVEREPADVGIRRALGLSYARLGASRLAREHLMAAVDLGARGAEERFALGEMLVEEGDLGRGIQALQAARSARPDDPDIRRALARALAASGDLERAVEELRSAHALFEGDEDALEDELDRVTARAFEQRVEELEGRLREDPDDYRARLGLALALAQQGEAEDALTQFERAAERSPKRAIDVGVEMLAYMEESARLTLLVSRLLREQGEVLRSIELVEEELARNPDDAELLLALYESYGLGGRRDEALAGLRELAGSGRNRLLRSLVETATRLHEADDGADYLLPAARALRRLGDVEQALEAFRGYLDVAPEDHDARQECALALENAGRWEQAFEVLRPLCERLDQLPLAQLERIARVALRAGQPEQALLLFQRAADRHPDDLALQRGLESARAGQREARIAALAGARDQDSLKQLAGLYAESGREQEARGVLASLGRTSENPELDYLRFCGEHFARIGRPDRAEAAWRSMAALLAHAPGSDPFKAFLYRAAELHQQAGDRRAARQALLEIQAHDPGYRDVEAKLEALTDVLPQGRVDERLVGLLEVDAPLATLLDAVRQVTLD